MSNKIKLLLAFILIKLKVIKSDGKPPYEDPNTGLKSYSTKGLNKYNPISYLVLLTLFLLLIIIAPF